MTDTTKDKSSDAAGGVRSSDDAVAMIGAGATRLGTSFGALIVSGEKSTGE